MSAELTFRDVSYPGFFDGFSCEIQAGCSALIVTARETESTLLTRLITGLSYPSQGSVLVDNREVAKLAADQLYQFRRDTGIVPSNGGLISNLKVWENITLPLLYHSGTVTTEEEELALAHLATLGYSGNVMALPAHLSQNEKRIIATVRAIINRPRIIIYSNCFEGVPSDQMATFSRLTAEFHTASKDRISLYLASSADMATCLTVDRIIHLHEPAVAV
jgi:phospholipid/cholesterol/gamma-HCH transport system ATP-binding protein